MRKGQKNAIVVFFFFKIRDQMWEEEKELQRVRFLCFLRERVPLLSKISGDRTVGFLRAKKESCSTRRGQRVDSGFREFRKTL